MLTSAAARRPTNVFVHGFLTVNNGGEKMSKSRGTGISPLRYLEPGAERRAGCATTAAKLNAQVEDLDFNPGLRRPRQRRPGRQVRQHRQPRRRLPAKRFGGCACRPTTWAACSKAAAAGRPACAARHHRRALRGARVRQSAAREVMLLADRVNERRPAQALGAGQAPPGADSRAARRLQRAASRPSAC